MLFAEAPQLCQMRRALPFMRHASLAKGLSVHVSAGLLGGVFSAGGVLSRDGMAVSPVCRYEFQDEGARNSVSSQGALCSRVNKPRVLKPCP